MVAISKKLGQLKQWTGEKFGAVEKTNVSEDFRRLDLETESRKEGIDNLTISLTDYAKTLDKRSSQNKKCSVMSMISKSMMQQGKFHGEEKAIGRALVRMAQVEEKIQVLQESFAEKLRKGLLMDLMTLSSSMNDYATLKKKLESRRLDYDAKLNRLSKSKKEKPGLEEEMKTAQKKYHETLNDVENLMSTFAEREEILLGPLIDFIHQQNSYFNEAAKALVTLVGELTEPDSKIGGPSTRSQENVQLCRKSSVKTVMPSSLASLTTTIEPGEKLVFESERTGSLPLITQIPVAPQIIANPSKPTLSNRSSTLKKSNNVLAKYDFDAEMPGEMSIRKGQTLVLLEKVDQGWWKGRIGENEGLFPANYVVEINDAPASDKSSSTLCGTCGCQDFTPHAFKPKTCNSCFHSH